MGLFADIFKRNKEIVIVDDYDVLYDIYGKKGASKRIALESVIGFIARVIMQSEFRVIDDNVRKKNDIYYRLNVKPNKNQTSSSFWYKVIYQLIYDGECLVVKTRDNHLVIADDYEHLTYAVREDVFQKVRIGDMYMSGNFKRSEVFYFKYGNEELSNLVDSLFADYGELIARMFEAQKMKGQLRATVNVDSTFLKTKEGQENLQSFIDRTYNAIKSKAQAIVPQQKGMEYVEHSKNASTGQSVDEINKATDSFLNQVCYAVGLSPSLLRGDVADIENTTRNAMKFCIDPIIKIINDELTMQLFNKTEYLEGDRIQVKRISYRDMFDVAVAVDKLISSSVVNGNELRDELGLEHSNDEVHQRFIMTKNYERTDNNLETDTEQT